MRSVQEPLRLAGPTDPELVQRVGDGDREALALLYDRHVGWLTVRLGRRCDQADLVDSAVQDAFLDVWRSAARWRPTGEVGAWIWTIALRRLVDHLRRRPPPVPVGVLPAEAVATEEVPLALGHTPLGAAFAALDRDLQVVLALTTFDGLTTAEAAALLGIPQGTVKTRLARARARLQEQLP